MEKKKKIDFRLIGVVIKPTINMSTILQGYDGRVEMVDII